MVVVVAAAVVVVVAAAVGVVVVVDPSHLRALPASPLAAPIPAKTALMAARRCEAAAGVHGFDRWHAARVVRGAPLGIAQHLVGLVE